MTGNPQRQRRLHHSHKQKLVITELEERFAAATLEHEQLVQQNSALQLRTAVLGDLIRASNTVDAAYEEAADIQSKGSENLSDLSYLYERILGWGSNVQQLALLVADALAHPTDATKQAMLAQTVDQLLNVSIVVPQSVGPIRYNTLLEMYYKKAFKELQGSEEEHWHNVAASLRLTTDQSARAAIAASLIHDRISKDGPMSIFKSVRSHAPPPPSSDHAQPSTHSNSTPTTTPTAQPVSSPHSLHHPAPPRAPCHSLDPSHASTGDRPPPTLNPNPNAGSSSTTAAPSAAWHTRTLRPVKAHPSETEPAASTSGSEPDAATSSGTASAGTEASAAPTAGALPRGTPSGAATDGELHDALTDLANLDTRMRRLTYWYHVFNMYIFTILLTPSQAALAFVNSYPLWASGPAIVMAHQEQVEQVERVEGQQQGQQQQQLDEMVLQQQQRGGGRSKQVRKQALLQPLEV